MIEISYDLTGEVLSYDIVRKLFIEAEEVCGKKLGITAALAWANNFEFPPEVGIRDTAGVKSHHGCLTCYVKSIHERDKDIRLNLSRISKLIPTSDPDYDAIQRLVEGIPIFTSETFQPNNGIINGKKMKLRTKYLTMPLVINRLVYDLYAKGKVIILPTDIAKNNRTTHYSA